MRGLYGAADSDESRDVYKRQVIDLKKDADAQNIINMLYKKTRLEDTFSVNMLAVCDGKPETLGLKEILEHHVDFQFELADRKYKNLLGRELEKKEIQEGLIKAYDVIDLIIEILRGKVEVEKGKGQKQRIVITQIPYTMMGANIGKFLNDVANLVETKKAPEIADIDVYKRQVCGCAEYDLHCSAQYGRLAESD